MKQLVLLLFFVPIASIAQNPFPMENGIILYQGVVQVDSASATDLKSRAKNWLFTVIKSPKSAIEVDEAGTLSAKITYDHANNPGSLLSARARIYIPLQLEFKDGRYRYTITNLRYGSEDPRCIGCNWPLEKLADGRLSKAEQRMAEGTDRAIREQLIDSLKKAETSTKSDW